MPRKSRIDVPGALHHIIARGIESNKLFQDDFDCDNFLERLVVIVQETGSMPIATVIRRLLTGVSLGVRRSEKILSERKYSSTDLLKTTYMRCVSQNHTKTKNKFSIAALIFI